MSSARTPGEAMDHTSDYRGFLQGAIHAASRDFDRTVLTLSGGAFAVSVAFIQSIAPQPVHLWSVLSAWILFAVSLVGILISIPTSGASMRSALNQLDEGTTLDRAAPAGILGRVTGWLNLAAAGAFVAGVAFLIAFVLLNLKGG
jgi:hypothetical protein